MAEFFSHIDELINTTIAALGIYGPILGCLFICVESMIPILPLSVFITLNFISFGNLLGFLISWICTIFGCCLSFFLCRSKLRNWFDHKLRSHKKIDHVMKVIEKINLEQLTVIIVTPFTPAFLINIAAGLSSMSFKKYLIALLIGKGFMVYFWGYVGTTLIQSLTNPSALIKVCIMILIAYIISYIISKKFHLDEVK